MEGASTTTRRRHAESVAAEYGGVLSRALLAGFGVDDAMVRREVAADRWALHGRRTVAMTRAEPTALARRWRAVWEVGTRIAVVDGVSALRHAGMTGFEDSGVHVSVPHRVTTRPHEGVTVHKVGRRHPTDVIGAGLPRARVAVAAIRGAHWAVSDRQAALILCLPVQQRLCTGQQLVEATTRIRGRTRRAFISAVVGDIAAGAQSLGELDVVAACRRRGLPEPDLQELRQLPTGRVYLDLRWRRARLVVEVDGAGHGWGLAPLDDALRQNAVVLGDDLVLRVPVLGWRLTPDAYLDQIVTAHAQRCA